MLRLLLLAIATLLLASGCGMVPGAGVPAQTPTPAPPFAGAVTATPALNAEPTRPASPTPGATPAPSPTAAPTATTPPTQTPLPATPVPVAPTPAGATRVQIFMVVVDDNGRSGKRIGCNDSVVPVDAEIEPTTSVLRAALERLLSARQQRYGADGRYYNALHASRLQIDRLEIGADGRATVALSGSVSIGGVCDEPRLIAQIEETVRQFPNVRSTAITVNGRPLEQSFR